MSSNPNHVRRRKEKQINAIARTALVAVFVTLGLALPAFRAVSDQAADLAAWQRRVRANESLLRLIAGSGPQGAYAQAALDRGKALAAEQQTPHERMTP